MNGLKQKSAPWHLNQDAFAEKLSGPRLPLTIHYLSEKVNVNVSVVGFPST
jgi:hypothetical protein